jgi:GMP synthase (glutamine-hydrolysing)
MPTVLVLQHADIETPGTIGDALDAAGIARQTILCHAGQPVPRDTKKFDGLLVMGGPQSVYEQDKFPYLRDELRLIESALDAGKPILGVCLGSQLLAAALGARVYAGKHKEIGWYPVTTAKDDFWKGAPAKFMAFHWHGDVFDLPAGATSLASSELTPCQAFRYGANAVGLLFHMEVTRALVAGMVTTFADELHAAKVDARRILRGAEEHLPALQKTGAMIFRRWAKLLT